MRHPTARLPTVPKANIPHPVPKPMASGLEYAIHRVIREYAAQGETRLGIVKTYKTTFDVYRQLKNATPRLDLYLPWSWYIHGPVVQYRFISPDALQVGEPERRNDGEAPYRPVTTGNLDYDNVSPSTRERIDEAVGLSVKEFADMTASDTTNRVYEKWAPHPFERSFRKLARGFDADEIDYDEKDLRTLDRVQQEFPYGEFPDLVPAFVDWSAFMRMAIERYPKFLWDRPGVVKGFQNTYGHRMSLDYNENVAPLIPSWKANYTAALELLQNDLTERRWELGSIVSGPRGDAFKGYRGAVLEDIQERAGLA